MKGAIYPTFSQNFPEFYSMLEVRRSGGQKRIRPCVFWFWHSIKSASNWISIFWAPKIGIQKKIATYNLPEPWTCTVHLRIPRNLTYHRPQVTVENLGVLDQNVDTSRWQCLNLPVDFFHLRKVTTSATPFRVGVVKGGSDGNNILILRFQHTPSLPPTFLRNLRRNCIE